MKLEVKNKFARGSWIAKIYVFTISKRIGGKTYQPTPYIDFLNLNTRRREGSITRWKAIKSPLKELRPNSVMDLGCAEGYFVFMAARETSAIATGIDSSAHRLFYATYQQIFSPTVQNTGFIKANIDIDLLDRLPKQDVFICLSLVHHIMYEHGYDYALEFMKKLKKLTNKALFFEMGHSEEKKMKWASELPDMSPDVDKWIEEFLHKAGYKEVSIINKSASYRHDSERALYIARV